MKEKINYESLHYIESQKRWDDKSLQAIQDMLEVWDDMHKIVICHPNIIFKNKPVTKDVKDFEEIDWQEVDEMLSFDNADCYVNLYPDCAEPFKYLHRRFRHELFKDARLSKPRHLAVIELDLDGGTLVRGMFRATVSDLQIAENPLYTKYKPKSIWEKHLRISTDSRSEMRWLEEFKRANAQETPSEM